MFKNLIEHLKKILNIKIEKREHVYSCEKNTILSMMNNTIIPFACLKGYIVFIEFKNACETEFSLNKGDAKITFVLSYTQLIDDKCCHSYVRVINSKNQTRHLRRCDTKSEFVDCMTEAIERVTYIDGVLDYPAK